MLLTKSEFDKKFKNKTLKLAFIGMSNIGKSFRSKELVREKNFNHYCVDEQIGDSLNINSEAEMAQWLGYPYEDRFTPNQAIYLKHEGRLTREASIPEDYNLVLDTTGSVIYLANDILDYLKKNFLIIHFETPKNMIEQMIENYFLNPKPVVWGDSFYQHDDESHIEALKRCYPELLNFRRQRYLQLKDISIDFARDENVHHDEFWEKLRNLL